VVAVVAAAQLHAGTPKLWYVKRVVSKVRHTDLNVDDRLGRQARHRGIADTLDSWRRITEA